MDGEDNWASLLKDHPIFTLPKPSDDFNAHSSLLELSTSSLPSFTHADPTNNGQTPSGRRQVMVLKDSDLVVAAGKEIRITSLGDAKLGRSTRKTYKTLHTPNIQFEIRQIALNPSGKLLAVAGSFQVAVIVLPRTGFTRLVPDSVDCKSVQVGQFYHASSNSASIAKIDWHPWGDGGSTLLVMTSNGKLSEYDISIDTEEPQQVLSFIPEKKQNVFMAEDESEREVTSFTLGKGRADWGPLTMYALTKSGDIYSICPYMPKNASIPSSYIHTLECFISAKQEFLAQGTTSASQNLSTLYDYQHKFVMALVKQLPSGTHYPAPSRSVLMHPPNVIKPTPSRQGPFLLQPSPKALEGSEGGDATDIIYLAFGTGNDDPDEANGETEHLGVMMVTYQDGKVDVFLDVEKIEARWDVKQSSSRDLPMLAVYESIDLGLVTMLSRISVNPNELPILDLLQGNHPVSVADPIHDDTIYVYHAFGVHAINIGPLLQSLSAALRNEDDEAETSLNAMLQKSAGSAVYPILTTFSVERKSSNPVIGVTVPNDVYLTYSIFILTSAMRISVFPLYIRPDSPRIKPKSLSTEESIDGEEKSHWLVPADTPLPYVSLLGAAPYTPPPIFARPTGLPPHPKLLIPTNSKEFMLTPDTLRFIGTTVAQLSSQIHDIQLSSRAIEARVSLQQREILRQAAKCKEMELSVENMKGSRRVATEAKIKQIQQEQKNLFTRLHRMLQALMEKASPELSEHEKKWFEELKRMKEEIAGLGNYDEGSLSVRTRLLEREYERLLPNLKALLEKESERKNKLVDNNKKLGLSQAFELGKRSNLERTRISEIEKEIEKLAVKLDVTLGQPPSGSQ